MQEYIPLLILVLVLYPLPIFFAMKREKTAMMRFLLQWNIHGEVRAFKTPVQVIKRNKKCL